MDQLKILVFVSLYLLMIKHPKQAGTLTWRQRQQNSNMVGGGAGVRHVRSVHVRRSKIGGALAPLAPPPPPPPPQFRCHCLEAKILQTPDMGKLLHFMVFACLCLAQINANCRLTQNLIVSIAFPRAAA